MPICYLHKGMCIQKLRIFGYFCTNLKKIMTIIIIVKLQNLISRKSYPKKVANVF